MKLMTLYDDIGRCSKLKRVALGRICSIVCCSFCKVHIAHGEQ